MKKEYLEENSIIEYEFKILIKSSDLKGYQIKSRILQYFSRKFYYPEKDLDNYKNSVHEIVNFLFQRHFKFLGNNKAYLTNYREREGSLEITFAIILICGYGGIRETVDYFSEDLQSLFGLGNDFDISVNYKEKKSKRAKSSIKGNQIIQLEQQLKTLKIMLAFSFFLSIVLGMYALSLNEKITDLNTISKMIEEKIKSNNSEMKLDYLFRKEIKEESKAK